MLGVFQRPVVPVVGRAQHGLQEGEPRTLAVGAARVHQEEQLLEATQARDGAYALAEEPEPHAVVLEELVQDAVESARLLAYE